MLFLNTVTSNGMDPITSIFYIVILIISVMVHEIAHGFTALFLGDKTALYAGRLTLNPIKHIDWVGSIFLPLILVLSGTGFVVGWAKPVPYNPYNLRNQRWGELAVASAGIIVNLLIVLLFGFIIKIGATYFPDFVNGQFFTITKIIVLLNIVLALFNLVPIPPLDGSKILFALLHHRARKFQNFLQTFSLPILIFFIIFLWQSVSSFIFFLFNLFTGSVF